MFKIRQMEVPRIRRRYLVPRSLLRPVPDFLDKLKAASLTPSLLAERAHISRTSLYGWLNPATQPQRRGGMNRATAWAIARVYGESANLTEKAAFAELFVEQNPP